MIQHTIEFVEEVPANHETGGIAAHYKCSVCNKLFSNAAGTAEITEEALPTTRLYKVDLAALTDDIILLDGDIVSGKLGSDSKIMIADGGTVTLRNADITCLTGDAEYAGITPLGDATIIIEGTNTVKGGKITAYGGNSAAGIGSGEEGSCGNITIAGTVTRVTATKGTNAPRSIGAGKGGRCGTVIIEDETKVTLN